MEDRSPQRREVNQAVVNTLRKDSKQDLTTSVGKALALLNAFDSSSTVLGVTELARFAGMPKSTSYRLLVALETGGFVERDGTNYRLAARLFELGNLLPHCRPSNLRDIALPYLSDLYELSHETVHLATVDGLDVLYLEKIYGHNPVRSPSHVGKRVAAHCAAIGKAILAQSDETVISSVIRNGLRPRTPRTIVLPHVFRSVLKTSRAEGVAYDHEEASVGLSCVAAPIMVSGNPIAAISISGGAPHFDPKSYAGAVRKAARTIGTSLTAARAASWEI